jgi:hypothetical protein
MERRERERERSQHPRRMATGLHLKEVAAAYELYAPEGAVLSAHHASDVIELVKEVGVDHRYFVDDQHLGSLPPTPTMVA